MEFFLDSANLAEIEEALKLGIIDGVTTTPTFMHKNGITDIDGAIIKLSKMVPVLMIEALGETSEQIVAEAHLTRGIAQGACWIRMHFDKQSVNSGSNSGPCQSRDKFA